MIQSNTLEILNTLVQTSTRDELLWMSGYLAGKVEHGLAPSSQASIDYKPTIIYGTETGNSKKVATQILTSFKKQAITAKSVDASQYDIKKITKEQLLIIVISTHGEGELPENSHALYTNLKENKPNLSEVKFAIMALGDSSYSLFCNAGYLFQELLQSLGATELIPMVTADTDYKQNVLNFETTLLQTMQQSVNPIVENIDTVSVIPAKKIYTGSISHRVLLNDRGSNKQTYHIEISTDEELQYAPGDVLSFVAQTSEAYISTVFDTFNIPISDQEKYSQIIKNKHVTKINKNTIQKFESILNETINEPLIDLVELAKKYPSLLKVSFDEILDTIQAVPARKYSIASSKAAHDNEVHLTINLHDFTINDSQKIGLASEHIIHFPLNTPFEFTIHRNDHFKLPKDDNAPIIMIGPGTGIAPFRSFLSHRDAIGATGKNWLVFGEQHFVTDFYYQTEIQEWIATGVIAEFDAAFSRDQKEKIYVQHRLKAKAKLLSQWLQEGAYLYICGQKDPMSKDVEQTIIEILVEERQITVEEAQELLDQMILEEKYLKDVY